MDKTECDRLRALARAENAAHRKLVTRSQKVHRAGNGAAALALSKRSKVHGARRDSYNAQACNLIFRANNRHLSPDTIDLHGLYVTEAKEILTARIDAIDAEERYGSERLLRANYGSGRLLRVIVGRGNHSTNGERKLAPVVEGICQNRGLLFREDETNPGRILISLRLGDEGGVLLSGLQQAPLPSPHAPHTPSPHALPPHAPPSHAPPSYAPPSHAPPPHAPPPQASRPPLLAPRPLPQANAMYQPQYSRYQSQYGGPQPQYGGPQPQNGDGYLPQYVTNTDRSGSGGSGLCVSLICLLGCFGFLYIWV